MTPPNPGGVKLRVAVLTADDTLAETVRASFGASASVELALFCGTVASHGDALAASQARVIVIDLADAPPVEMAAVAKFMARVVAPVVALTQGFDQGVARSLVQMRIADFLVKPVTPVDLLRACARVAAQTDEAPRVDAETYAFIAAVGGAGVTTLAVQTALTLLNSSGPRNKPATCLVDLDFQHGAVADYLDIEPRLNLAEIEPRPDRLDRQLLEVMLSQHSSGLSVIAAPNRPAEMRTFDHEMVTRLLDLVSANFDYVVFDMPRTWFAWTDSVLLGSDKLYVVSESTVPGLRHARQLVNAIKERLGGVPCPQVIVNRFQPRMFSSGLNAGDVRATLGDDYICAVPNDYALVREAIDRGVPLDEVKPGNKVSAQIRKLIIDGMAVRQDATPLLITKLKRAVTG